MWPTPYFPSIFPYLFLTKSQKPLPFLTFPSSSKHSLSPVQSKTASHNVPHTPRQRPPISWKNALAFSYHDEFHTWTLELRLPRDRPSRDQTGWPFFWVLNSVFCLPLCFFAPLGLLWWAFSRLMSLLLQLDKVLFELPPSAIVCLYSFVHVQTRFYHIT